MKNDNYVHMQVGVDIACRPDESPDIPEDPEEEIYSPGWLEEDDIQCVTGSPEELEKSVTCPKCRSTDIWCEWVIRPLQQKAA